MPQVNANVDLTQVQPEVMAGQTAQPEDWRTALERYLPDIAQTGAEVIGSAGAGSQGITPQTTAVLGNQAAPWLGLSSAMKGFGEGFNKVMAEQQAVMQGEEKGKIETQKRLDETINKVQSSLKSDSNVNDELTRADSISIAKDLLSNSADYGDKFASAFMPVFQAIIKPEFKRLNISDEGISNPADVFKVLTQSGIKGISEEGIQKLLGGGILTTPEIAPFKAIIRDFEKRNKSNFTRYVTPYVNSFEDAGFGEYAERHIPVPEGYKIKPSKKGDRDVNSSGDPIVFDGTGWVADTGETK